MSTPLGPGDTRRRMARLVTEVMSPVVLIVVVIVVVAVSTAGLLRGLLLGMVAIFFTGGLPFGLVLVRVRKGQLTDHHISRREQRPPVMALALASAGAGLLVLRWLDAPRALFALLAGTVAGLVVALAITTFWKISIHAAAAAGMVASLAILVGPRWLLLAPLVVLSGWARVQTRAHTPAQVLAGAVVGAGIAAGATLLGG